MLYLRDIVHSLPFIIASILASVIPSIGVAYVRYEYSAVVSGLVSMLVTALMSHYNIGLSKNYIPNYDRRSKARHNYYRFYKNWLKSHTKVKDELILDQLIMRVMYNAHGEIKDMQHRGANSNLDLETPEGIAISYLKR